MRYYARDTRAPIGKEAWQGTSALSWVPAGASPHPTPSHRRAAGRPTSGKAPASYQQARSGPAAVGVRKRAAATAASRPEVAELRRWLDFELGVFVGLRKLAVAAERGCGAEWW